MLISIDGFKGKQADELREAVEFFALQLMDPRMVRNLTIDIEKSRKLDVMGECVNEDDTKSPRWFTITLRGDKDDDDPVKTLAHEMVHVKQYAKNELSKQLRVSKGKGFRLATKWHGEFWLPKSKEDAYWDAPWEVQAYGMEVGLYHKWCSRHDPKSKYYVGVDA